jgi:hypothetical protein
MGHHLSRVLYKYNNNNKIKSTTPKTSTNTNRNKFGKINNQPEVKINGRNVEKEKK